MEDLQGLACDDWPSFYFHDCFVGGTCLCSAVGDLGLQFILKGSRRWLYSDWAERIQESNHMAKKRKAKKTKVKRKRSAKKNNAKGRSPRKPDLRLVAKRNEAAEIPRALTPHDIFEGIKGRRPNSDEELNEWLASPEGKVAMTFEQTDLNRWGETGRS
jgi:hypothetical protein